jgi:hypothetical protein
MPVTKRADLVIPELLVDAVRGAFAGATALYGSAVATVHMGLPGDKKGGDTVTVPYFNTLGDAEDLLEGDALTPEGITSTKETATVIHTGKAFAITQWAQWASWGDPYEEAGRQLKKIFVRRWDKALIDVAANNVPSAYQVDLTGLTDKTLSYDNVLTGRQKWGDEQEDISLMVMHSDVYFDILRKKDLDGRPLITTLAAGPDGARLAYWGGALIRFSDKCSKTFVSGTTYNYTSYLLKEGALAIWANADVSTDEDKDILADARIVAAHHYFAAHRYLRAPGSSKSPVVSVKSQITF